MKLRVSQHTSQSVGTERSAPRSKRSCSWLRDEVRQLCTWWLKPTWLRVASASTTQHRSCTRCHALPCCNRQRPGKEPPQAFGCWGTSKLPACRAVGRQQGEEGRQGACTGLERSQVSPHLLGDLLQAALGGRASRLDAWVPQQLEPVIRLESFHSLDQPLQRGHRGAGVCKVCVRQVLQHSSCRVRVVHVPISRPSWQLLHSA